MRGEMSQGQKQGIRVGMHHGVVKTLRCLYVDNTSKGMPSWQRTRAMEDKRVAVLVFRGHVRRVFCQHLQYNLCCSETNPNVGRLCLFAEPDARGRRNPPRKGVKPDGNI
jgi:hypothetical protein